MTVGVDIAVKKDDGATNITWSIVSGSGGDKSPALWRSNSAAGTLGQKPMFYCASKSNQAGDVRRIDMYGSFPGVYTNSSTGQTEVRGKCTFSASFAVPQNMTSTDVAEFASQVTNLIADVNLKSAIKTGFAPT
jgi:hypothetical protein